MPHDSLQKSISDLGRWKSELVHTIDKYRQWLNQSGLATAETELRIHDVISAVRSDRLTIAFVAEFSRGKTELINSIFFADYKRRLLPSTVGRTTMCPTELFYDNELNSAYISLLPIETRSEDSSIAELKNDPNSWVRYQLDVDAPDQMAQTLKEIVKTKAVPLEKAKELGLYTEENSEEAPPEEVEIPVWRHAMISFPHPLLEQGLVILDTPGLNALGTEPELTLSMLPSAQAVVFVLSADTGVTRSDLDMWQYYIKGASELNQKGVIATLNKIDALWDEMMSDEEVNNAIEAQRSSTAAMLGLDPLNVLTVSAQKALLAKTRGDDALLEKSRLLQLEMKLANEIVPIKQQLVQDQVLRIIGNLMNQNRDILQGRLDKIRNHLNSLSGLSGRNTDVIKHLTQKTQEQQLTYNKNMKLLQSCKRTLAQQSAAIMNELSLEAFDYLITKTRREMMESWTTVGLKKGMQTFFHGLRDTMQVVARQTKETHELVKSVYEKFHQDHDLPELEVPMFDMKKYFDQMEQLYKQEEEFRNSPVTTMTEQSFVVKKFFVSIVSHARETFYRAHQEADAWLKDLMAPLISQIHMHKELLEQHLETLCKITETKDSLTKKITDLETMTAKLKEQLDQLLTIEKQLNIACGKTADSSPSASGSTSTPATETA